VVTWPVMRNAIVMNFWNQVLYLIPATISHIYVQEKEMLPQEAPGGLQLIFEVFICFFLYDTVYFAWHLLHHKIDICYSLVHSTHHEYHAPFSWVAQHVHPLELIETGCLAIAVPKLMGCHPFSMWIWLIILTLLRIETHSGYCFPYQLSQLIPFGLYGGSIAHDYHHQHPEYNFQPFLTYWDKLLGYSYVPTHPHLGITPHEGNPEDEEQQPGYLFQMFLLPDVIVRWFDIEYQARCYALLYSSCPNKIHVASFVMFITSFFAVTAALNNLTKNVTLLLVSLALCGFLYQPHRFRILVVVSLIFFWLTGHALVALLGAYVVKKSYVAVVTLSVFINMIRYDFIMKLYVMMIML
jgi:sterol desaturase/sphingolipid hydroxylase (fatty acid hydroxylase superfamily)